mgnify:CR=1 FL=1
MRFFWSREPHPDGVCARFARLALTCAHRACRFITVSEHDHSGELDHPVPQAVDEAPAALVARRRDVRGARRREQILQLLQTVESGALTVEEIAERLAGIDPREEDVRLTIPESVRLAIATAGGPTRPLSRADRQRLDRLSDRIHEVVANCLGPERP